VDRQRLLSVVEQLCADLDYATGARKFPGTVAPDEAAGIADALHDEMEGHTAERARLAVANSVPIACGRACTGCCEELVIVSLPEALTIAHWLSRPENAERRAAFLAGYASWRAAAGDAPETIAALTVRNQDRARYAEAHVAYWRRRILCAFNLNGDCSIYPVRPLVCRDAHAVGSNERCFGDHPGSVPAVRIQYEPAMGFLRHAHMVLQAAHNAVSDEANRHEPLCAVVYRLLTNGGCDSTTPTSSAL
jgi:hypothetical protein